MFALQSWVEADEFCKFSGLTLAKIENVAQANFLRVRLETHFSAGKSEWNCKPLKNCENTCTALLFNGVAEI